MTNVRCIYEMWDTAGGWARVRPHTDLTTRQAISEIFGRNCSNSLVATRIVGELKGGELVDLEVDYDAAGNPELTTWTPDGYELVALE